MLILELGNQILNKVNYSLKVSDFSRVSFTERLLLMKTVESRKLQLTKSETSPARIYFFKMVIVFIAVNRLG